MRTCMNKITLSFVPIALLMGLLLGKPGQGYARGIAPQVSACSNLVVNGDMQDDSGWNLSGGPIASQYSSDGRDGPDGTRGLRIGPSNDLALKGQRWSSALQKVTLPATGPLTLSFWYSYVPDPQATKDGIQVALLDNKGDVLTFFFKETNYSNVWRQFSADISEYAGREVQIFFAVESDGATGKTQLLIDDVELCDPTTVVAQPTTAPAEATTAPAVVVAAPTTAPAVATNEVAAVAGDLTQFSNLGVADQTLRQPFDTASVVFGLPADWQLSEGAAVQLDLTTFLNGGTGKVDTDRLSGSVLDVSFNGIALTPVPLDKIGSTAVTLPIPAAALVPQATNGLHELLLTLKSGPNCNVDQQVGVIVRATSSLNLAHTTVAPSTDLATLPRPIYQRSLAPDVATIIVPDKPTSSELEAALVIAAGFGRMTDGKLGVNLAPLANLTPEQRQGNNLIFVGKPSAFPLLSTVELPAPIDGDSFKAASATPSDGVVQMAVSPWNAAKVVLVVGGGDDAAVIKAGKALSAGTLRGGSQPNVAVVADVRAASTIANVATERSFATLGYGETTVTGRGNHLMTFNFDVPADRSVGSDAYVNLVLNHSTLLDYDRSSVTFTLNGQPIRGLRLDDETAALNTLRLNIPASAVRSGVNELAIDTQFAPEIACSTSDATDLWMTIWPESALHLPLNSLDSRTVSRFDLGNYPQPFSSNASLDTTAFVLPSNDPVAWDVAAQVAFKLGTHTAKQVVDLTVAYGDAIPENVRTERDLLVIGQPQALALIGELSDALPLPFEAGTNTATERGELVMYRTPQDTDSGYVQLLTAPWNAKRAVLVVLGGTDEAVRQAGAALIASDVNHTLRGNLAIVRDNQVVSTGQSGVVDSTVASATDGTQAPEITPFVVQRPSWILPTISAAAILILVIIAFVAFTSRRQRGLAGSNSRARD